MRSTLENTKRVKITSSNSSEFCIEFKILSVYLKIFVFVFIADDIHPRIEPASAENAYNFVVMIVVVHSADSKNDFPEIHGKIIDFLLISDQI